MTHAVWFDDVEASPGGVARVQLTVLGPGGSRGSRARFGQVLLDTGAIHTQLPSEVLHDIGVAPSGRHRLISTANGPVDRDVTTVDLQVHGVFVPRAVVLTAPGAVPLLGRSALYRAFRTTGLVASRWYRSLDDVPMESALGRTRGAVAADRSLALRLIDAGEQSALVQRLITGGEDPPPSAFALLFAGRLLLVDGQIDGAEAALETVVGLDDSDAAAHARNLLAELAASRGDDETAVRLWQQVIDSGQIYASPEAAWRLGCHFAEQGDQERALAAYRVAAEPWPAIAGGAGSPVLKARAELSRRSEIQ